MIDKKLPVPTIVGGKDTIRDAPEEPCPCCAGDCQSPCDRTCYELTGVDELDVSMLTDAPETFLSEPTFTDEIDCQYLTGNENCTTEWNYQIGWPGLPAEVAGALFSGKLLQNVSLSRRDLVITGYYFVKYPTNLEGTNLDFDASTIPFTGLDFTWPPENRNNWIARLFKSDCGWTLEVQSSPVGLVWKGIYDGNDLYPYGEYRRIDGAADGPAIITITESGDFWILAGPVLLWHGHRANTIDFEAAPDTYAVVTDAEYTRVGGLSATPSTISLTPCEDSNPRTVNGSCGDGCATWWVRLRFTSLPTSCGRVDYSQGCFSIDSFNWTPELLVDGVLEIISRIDNWSGDSTPIGTGTVSGCIDGNCPDDCFTEEFFDEPVNFFATLTRSHEDGLWTVQILMRGEVFGQDIIVFVAEIAAEECVDGWYDPVRDLGDETVLTGDNQTNCEDDAFASGGTVEIAPLFHCGEFSSEDPPY